MQAMTKEKHEAKEQDAKKGQPMAPSGSFIHCNRGALGCPPRRPRRKILPIYALPDRQAAKALAEKEFDL